MYWEARTEFDRRASRLTAWGMALTALAALLLVWLGCLLTVPTSVESGSREVECDAPISSVYSPGSRNVCADERQWPEFVGILGLAVPFGVTGAALWVSGSTRRRTTAHVLRLLEIQESEERSRAKG
ncbi:hypothetical protein OG233_18235 [Streptomyces sp. NBC_01218]|uniref:hypothetical protein n=1 Tax=unclassified Streptomyces TaxID=2593676 RepID=UPI002E143D25|nr:hypothetical protein OG233_18235 [Streptomyces sp. NBC_01218]